jgi:YD repeat-containing protein
MRKKVLLLFIPLFIIAAFLFSLAPTNASIFDNLTDGFKNLFAPKSAFAEGNPFVPTTDIMETGLIAQVGSNSLFTASQNIANFTDITGAYYDATLNRIVFIGTTRGSSPKFNKDDMAVAIQSIIFNNTMPDVNIGDDPSNPGSSTAVVTYTGAIQNTNLGNVLFNSDYKLKQYVIGYDPNNIKITSSVPTYKSVVDRYVALDPNPVTGNQTNFILSPQDATLKNSTSANAFVFLNLSMQATAQHTNPTNDAQWNQASTDFVSDITTNYDQYAQETIALTQAKQIAKIVAILKWITDKNISTDFHWAQNYTPQVVSTPTTVQKVTTPVFPNGYSAQGQISFTTPNTYVPDDGIAASLKSSSQAVSTSKEDITWTFTNEGQQYQAVAVTADAFKSLGGYSTSVVDMGIPIAGDLSLIFQRSYSSFSNAQFGIGLGWEFMPARLYPNSTLQDLDVVICNDLFFFTKLAIDTPYGHETFTFNCPNGYAPDDPSFHSKLVQNPDESFTVTSSDQTRYLFNSDFQLTTIQDKNGNKINYSYDSSGKIISIADTKNHQLVLSYNGQSLISQVSDWTNRKVQYAYDSTGRLTVVTDPNSNTTSYGYDSSSRLTTITDRTGAVVLTNTYNPDARIATQKYASGVTKTNTYDNTNKLITQTDNNGRAVKTTYDAKSRILQQKTLLERVFLIHMVRKLYLLRKQTEMEIKQHLLMIPGAISSLLHFPMQNLSPIPMTVIIGLQK